MPAHEPDKADTNVLQYSMAEKLFRIAFSEKATTEARKSVTVSIVVGEVDSDCWPSSDLSLGDFLFSVLLASVILI